MDSGVWRSMGFGVLIWLVGFVWGTIVFMTAVLKSIPSIPYVSNYPAISFPLLLVWLFLVPFLAGRLLRPVEDKVGEGVKIGAIFASLNMLLDVLVLVLALRAGLGFFASLTVWVAYSMLFLIPVFVGHLSQSRVSGDPH